METLPLVLTLPLALIGLAILSTALTLVGISYQLSRIADALNKRKEK